MLQFVIFCLLLFAVSWSLCWIMTAEGYGLALCCPFFAQSNEVKQILSTEFAGVMLVTKQHVVSALFVSKGCLKSFLLQTCFYV